MTEGNGRRRDRRAGLLAVDIDHFRLIGGVQHGEPATRLVDDIAVGIHRELAGFCVKRIAVCVLNGQKAVAVDRQIQRSAGLFHGARRKVYFFLVVLDAAAGRTPELGGHISQASGRLTEHVAEGQGRCLVAKRIKVGHVITDRLHGLRVRFHATKAHIYRTEHSSPPY